MGQYHRDWLKVTKSTVQYGNRTIPISEIDEVYRPQHTPEAAVIALIMGGFVSAVIGINLYVIGFFLLVALGAYFTPQKVVVIKTNNGAVHRISLARARKPNIAVHTIRENVLEYQNRNISTAYYAPTPISMPLSTPIASTMYPPEELVRQYVLQLLTSTFGYRQSDIGYEFSLQLGSSQKRADVAVFFPGAPHTQDNIFIIVECKRKDRDDGSALDQLKSYMSACVNARYGVVASYRWVVVEKTLMSGRFQFTPIPALIAANGIPLPIIYAPAQPMIRTVPTYSEPTPYLIEEAIPTERNWRQNLVVAGVIVALGCGTCMFITTLLPRPEERMTRPPNAAPQAEAVVEAGISFPPSNSDSVEINQPEATVLLIPTYETQPAFATPSFVTFTPQPRATHTQTLPITAAPEIAATQAEISNLVFGVVQATQNINVRRLANTGANVVGILRTGDRVEIIGENADRSWLEVRLDADTTGWVAAFLVRIENGGN